MNNLKLLCRRMLVLSYTRAINILLESQPKLHSRKEFGTCNFYAYTANILSLDQRLVSEKKK